MSYFHQNSVFWVEVDKISPNPFQPRKDFDEEELQSLANSIRQYGVLQALVVTRKEVPKDDGGLSVEYELISGERRLKASKLAGIKEVPVLIRSGEESDLMKLELAIIENLQREDLNVVERARAFEKLAKEFSFNKAQIARKVGKSREYVSNTMRILSLPDDILDALSSGKISEGHARPLLMLVDRPSERQTLFKEIIYKKISVREAERIAKKIAKERVRKPVKVNPEIEELEKKFTESLGTRVNIETKEVGGKVSIDYFSEEDLHTLLKVLVHYKKEGNAPMLENFLEATERMENENSVPPEEAPTPISTDQEEDNKKEEDTVQEEEVQEKVQREESILQEEKAELINSISSNEEKTSDENSSSDVKEAITPTVDEEEVQEKVQKEENISQEERSGSLNDVSSYEENTSGKGVVLNENERKDTDNEERSGFNSEDVEKNIDQEENKETGPNHINEEKDPEIPQKDQDEQVRDTFNDNYLENEETSSDLKESTSYTEETLTPTFTDQEEIQDKVQKEENHVQEEKTELSDDLSLNEEKTSDENSSSDLNENTSHTEEVPTPVSTDQEEANKKEENHLQEEKTELSNDLSLNEEKTSDEDTSSEDDDLYSVRNFTI